MHFAIIAAGEGSRLREEGIPQPKPLVSIEGQPMIDRLMAIMVRCGAESISVICNSAMPDVCSHLEQMSLGIPLHLIASQTPSSMHSLAALADVIPEGKFCLTTVDTIFLESEFSSFIRTFADMKDGQKDGLFAVTPFVDDEKPLWVGTLSKNSFSCACAPSVGEAKEIVGFYDQECQIPAHAEKMVSGGIYCLDTHTAFPVLKNCLAQGQSRMRNFQRALIAAGLKLDAYVFPKIMDIDHASDIEKAETWIAESSKKILCIARDKVFSPNNEEKDAAILHAVSERLQQRGWKVEECSEEEFSRNEDLAFDSQYDRIFHMSRRQQSLQRLKQVSIPVVNYPQSVLVTAKSRSRTLALLEEAGISVPSWISLPKDPDKANRQETYSSFLFPAWLKTMRETGVQATDVCYVEDPQSLDSRLQSLRSDDLVTDLVLVNHVQGELVKCYVVMDRRDETPRFVKWFRPQMVDYSKFGEAESHNKRMEQFHVDENLISVWSRKIGSALDLNVFGFDVIVQNDGCMAVIDVNDWPSFSMCREVAAEAIASVIEQQ